MFLVLAVVLCLGAQLFYQFGWTRKKENKRTGGSVLGPYLGSRAILCVKEQTQSKTGDPHRKTTSGPKQFFETIFIHKTMQQGKYQCLSIIILPNLYITIFI